MLSDGPPSLEEVTTSLTWIESVEVNTLTSSGIIAPARVPHGIIAASFHQRVVSPPRLGTMSFETTNVNTTETIEVIQTSEVSGVSKFIWSALRYRALS